MADRQTAKPEIAAQKKTIKLAPVIGDWTTYKPPKVLAKKIKCGLYGFDRLSKEELNLALIIHYSFIEKLFKKLKIDLKMSVELFSVQVEQTTYLNFLRTLTNPIAQSKITISNSHDPIALILDLPIANSIINHSLGSEDIESLNRGLTEAEINVLTTTLNEYLTGYAAAFEHVVQKPILSFISSPDVSIDSAINTSSTFVTFTVEVSLADNPPAKISLGYLGNSLKYILARFKQKQREKPLDFSKLSSSLLSKIVIPATATLGQTSLTTSDINQLEVGDVVSLGTTINSAIELQIGDILKALCQPGKKDKKSAVKIAAISEEEHVEIAPPSLMEVSPPAAEAELPVEEEQVIETPQPEIEEEFAEEEEEEETEEFDLDEEDLTDEDIFLDEEEEDEEDEDEDEDEEDEDDEDI